MHAKLYWGTDLEHVMRVSLLTIALGAIWLAVMLMIGWYNPELHLLATTSSTVMVGTGNGWGIVERILKK